MRAPRVPVEEQYRLIMEYRKSALSDYQWCLNNDINPGTSYNWVKRLLKWWGQEPLNFYKIINLDIRTIEIVY